MLIEKSLIDFAEVTRSKEPTPGGGSVSAAAGLLGAALGQMVFGLTEGKKAYEALDESIKNELHHANEELKTSYIRLSELVDEDGSAFDEVMKAFGLPKETEDEKKIRKEAVQQGYKKALEVPLETAQKALNVLKNLKILAEYGNKNAITDSGVAVMMAHTACEGALFNVEINLSSLEDEAYKKEVEERVAKVRGEAHSLREALLNVVQKRMKG